MLATYRTNNTLSLVVAQTNNNLIIDVELDQDNTAGKLWKLLCKFNPICTAEDKEYIINIDYIIQAKWDQDTLQMLLSLHSEEPVFIGRDQGGEEVWSKLKHHCQTL